MSTTTSSVLEATDVHCHFTLPGSLLSRTKREVRAVDGVSLSVAPGEAVGLVGESGCGKSTFARAIVGLEQVQSGSIEVCGADLMTLPRSEQRRARRNVQLIFQDPFSSLNPDMTVRELLSEGWRAHPDVIARDRWDARVTELLEMVGLTANFAERRPRQFSGGQLQRIAIARALSVEPKLLVADEAVSALDVSVQAQVLNLLGELRKRLGLGILFISHDLSVIRHLCDRVAVMYLGKVVEEGRTDDVFETPTHPYTQLLMNSVPELFPWMTEQTKPLLDTGEMPSPISPPTGCRFHTRCPIAIEACSIEVPQLELIAQSKPGHRSACHRVERSLADAWNPSETGAAR